MLVQLRLPVVCLAPFRFENMYFYHYIPVHTRVGLGHKYALKIQLYLWFSLQKPINRCYIIDFCVCWTRSSALLFLHAVHPILIFWYIVSLTHQCANIEDTSCNPVHLILTG